MSRKIMLCGKTRKITKRADGRWELSFQYNKIRKFVYDFNQEKCIENFKEAWKNRNTLEKSMDKSKLTLNEWINIWYDTYKAKNLKESSLESIRICVKRMSNKIGTMPLTKISSLDIQNYLNSIEGSRQREITKNHLSNIFKYAIKNNLRKDNPMIAVEVKHINKQKEILTPDQQQTLLASIKDKKFKLLIQFYLATGVRRAEALSVRKQDINLDKGYIKIHGTKTKNAARLVPISKKLAEKLLATQCEEYIFEYRDEYISKAFKIACNKLGIFNVTVHSLRHTFATNCLRMGIPMKVVQAILGHASVNITSDLYTHLTQDIAFAEFAKITSVFDNTFDNTF